MNKKLYKYLDEETIIDIYKKYDENYINNILSHNSIDETVDILKKYKLNFINEILFYYFDIIDIDPKKLDASLNALKNQKPDNYVNLISQDILFLRRILEGEN